MTERGGEDTLDKSYKNLWRIEIMYYRIYYHLYILE